MRASLLALAALLVPQAAWADNWRMAAYSGTDMQQQLAYFVDIDSIQRTGTKITFNSQTIYQALTDARDFDRSVIKREADCANMSTRMLDSNFYAAGKFLGNESGAGDFVTAKTGTVLETMLNVACGRGDYRSPVVADPESWSRERFRTGFGS